MADVRTPTPCAAVVPESVRVSRSMSAKTGRGPFHATAWAVAANVNDGTMTSPDRSRARSTSINPEVHEDTATQWRTPRYSAAVASNALTRGPLVRIPERRTASIASATRAGSGTLGRVSGMSSMMTTSSAADSYLGLMAMSICPFRCLGRGAGVSHSVEGPADGLFECETTVQLRVEPSHLIAHLDRAPREPVKVRPSRDVRAAAPNRGRNERPAHDLFGLAAAGDGLRIGEVIAAYVQSLRDEAHRTIQFLPHSARRQAIEQGMRVGVRSDGDESRRDRFAQGLPGDRPPQAGELAALIDVLRCDIQPRRDLPPDQQRQRDLHEVGRPVVERDHDRECPAVQIVRSAREQVDRLVERHHA